MRLLVEPNLALLSQYCRSSDCCDRGPLRYMSGEQPDDAAQDRHGEGGRTTQIAATQPSSSPASHPSALEDALWPCFAWRGWQATSPQDCRGLGENLQPTIKRRRSQAEEPDKVVAGEEPELDLFLEAVPEADDSSPLIFPSFGMLPRPFEEAETRAMPRSGSF